MSPSLLYHSNPCSPWSKRRPFASPKCHSLGTCKNVSKPPVSQQPLQPLEQATPICISQVSFIGHLQECLQASCITATLAALGASDAHLHLPSVIHWAPARMSPSLLYHSNPCSPWSKRRPFASPKCH